MEWQRYSEDGKYLIVVSHVYSEESDMTFIMEETYLNDEMIPDPLISTEVKGFYHGEAAKEDTEEYYGKLKAEYDNNIKL